MKKTNIRLKIGSKVRELRGSIGISQEAFADVCGYSRTYMSQIERGVANITVDVIQVLADAFGIEPKVLFDFDPIVVKKSKKIRVPFDATGSSFNPSLMRLHARTYRVGEKGNERVFRSFEEALEFLKTMEVAKWRRPNKSGNWGIVKAVKWDYI